MAMLALFSVSLVVGYLILRYRVHIIIVVQPRHTTAAQRAATSKRPPAQPASEAPEVVEIASALVNLGCKPRHAKAAAERAVGSGVQDFDGLLRIAIKDALAC
jgi:Holliday junction resolvasome RuvABC DNA-binding subunit